MVVTARPQLQPNWRIEPNLTGQVSVADGGLSVVGIKINVSSEVKPFIDRAVNDQIGTLQSQLRNDPTIEQVARREWAKMCRSISFAAAGRGRAQSVARNAADARVRRASAGRCQQRHADRRRAGGNAHRAERRPSRTARSPRNCRSCRRSIRARVSIAAPIDIPFTEVNRLLEAQLKGRKFPDDPNSPAEVTIQRARVAPSGDRLLISLQVKAREKKSWFGFGADANVYVWGKPRARCQGRKCSG